MVRNEFLEDIYLLFQVSNLFLVVRRVLLTGLDDLLDTLSFDFNTVKVLIGTKQLGFHHLQLRLAFSLCIHLQHDSLIVLFELFKFFLTTIANLTVKNINELTSYSLGR